MIRKPVAVLVLIVGLCHAQAEYPAYQNCATKNDTQMEVGSVPGSPYPFCIAQNVCFTVKGSMKEDITQGSSLSIVGNHLGRIVYTDNHDFCALSAANGKSCPIRNRKSSQMINICILVKNNAPANIPVNLTISAINGNTRFIFFCQFDNVMAKNCKV